MKDLDFSDLDSILAGPAEARVDDYSTTTSPDDLLRDRKFLRDLRDDYADKGNYFDDDSDMIRKWISDMRWGEANTVSAGLDLAEVSNATGVARSRKRRLLNAWDRLPSFSGEGGGIGGAIADYAVAGILDPITIFGGAVGKAAGIAAAQAAKQGSKALIRQGVKAGMAKGAIQEAGANALAEGTINALQQGRDISLGRQDEFSAGELAGAAGFGAGAGAVLGGAIGGVSGGLQARRMGERVLEEELLARGVTPEGETATRTESALSALRETPGLGRLAGRKGGSITEPYAETRVADEARMRDLAEQVNQVNRERDAANAPPEPAPDAAAVEEPLSAQAQAAKLTRQMQRLKRDGVDESYIDALRAERDSRLLRARAEAEAGDLDLRLTRIGEGEPKPETEALAARMTARREELRAALERDDLEPDYDWRQHFPEPPQKPAEAATEATPNAPQEPAGKKPAAPQAEAAGKPAAAQPAAGTGQQPGAGPTAGQAPVQPGAPAAEAAQQAAAPPVRTHQQNLDLLLKEVPPEEQGQVRHILDAQISNPNIVSKMAERIESGAMPPLRTTMDIFDRLRQMVDEAGAEAPDDAAIKARAQAEAEQAVRDQEAADLGQAQADMEAAGAPEWPELSPKTNPATRALFEEAKAEGIISPADWSEIAPTARRRRGPEAAEPESRGRPP